MQKASFPANISLNIAEADYEQNLDPTITKRYICCWVTEGAMVSCKKCQCPGAISHAYLTSPHDKS